MRVLLPTIDVARGGVARYIDAIAKTLPEVEVVDVSASHHFTSKGFDAVWVHHILPIGTQAWLQHLRGSAPYVIFLHGLDFDLARRNAWKRFLTRRILRGAKHVVTNSHALATEVAAFARIPEPLVVYPCVDDALVTASAALTTIPTQDRVRLLTVGRLVERKGHLRVLEAMKDDARLNYTIVGDGPMREAILAKVQEYGISSRVHVLTDVADDELPDVYRSADVFVMPSSKSATDREGFGIVYLEAALFGIPSIAVRQPGVDEAVVDGETGQLIEDTATALQNILNHYSTDRSNNGSLGSAARARVLAEFTRDAQFGKLRAFL